MGFRITYESMYRHYIVHTKDGEVKFKKDEMALPYPDENYTINPKFTPIVSSMDIIVTYHLYIFIWFTISWYVRISISNYLESVSW